MAQKIFNEKQKEIVARKLGYDGPMSGFDKFVKSDPAMERKLNLLTAKFMARGGAVKKFATGGVETIKLGGAATAAGNTLSLANVPTINLPTRTPSTSPTPTIAYGPGMPDTPITVPSSAGSQTVQLGTIPSGPSSLTLNPNFVGGTATTTPATVTSTPSTTTTSASSPSSGVETINISIPERATPPADQGQTIKIGDVPVTTTAGTGATTPTDVSVGQPDEATVTNSGLNSYAANEAIQNAFSEVLGREANQGDLNYWLPIVLNQVGGVTLDNLKQVIANAAQGGDRTAAQSYLAGVAGPTAYSTGPTEKPTFTPATMDVAKIGAPGTEQLLSTTGRDVTAKTITDTTKAAAPDAVTAATAAGKTSEISAVTTEDKVKTAGANAITGTLSESAKAAAAEDTPSETALKNIEEAKLTNPREVAGVPERTLTAGELVSGPAVNQAQIDAAINQAEAATAAVKPEMTVQGQLDKLLADFDSGNPPAWAASSLRNANAVLSARGLGASSLAGQAIIQATLEAAVPIAAQDAQTVANLELQNLSNRQQIAVLVAQQRAAFLGQEFDQAFQTRVTNAARIADIANLNFSAEQQIALENARLAQSVDLANLSNEQAVIMARAAQIANLESANLNNRQQAALQNAQAFLQVDMANLSNRQQTALFNAEKNIQAMFTDAAAQNAAKQFNATSEMQVNQFYDSLSAQVSQFNVSQKSAIEQFNAGQENAIAQFNATAQNAVEQFNAQNRLIIDQSNAEWRRNISTIDTAAQNTANQFNAQAELQITIAELNNTWQVYRDNMEYAYNSGQNALDRENKLALQVLANEATILAADKQVTGSMFEAGGVLTAAIAAPLVKSWITGPSGGGGGSTNTVTYGTSSWADTFGTSSISTGGVSFDDVDSYIDYGASI